MTQDEIIEMTRQAGGFDATPEFLERFAKLVAAKAIKELESQEPVAWVQDVEFEQLPEFAFSWVKTRLHDKPLYTHPPQRTKGIEEHMILTTKGEVVAVYK